MPGLPEGGAVFKLGNARRKGRGPGAYANHMQSYGNLEGMAAWQASGTLASGSLGVLRELHRMPRVCVRFPRVSGRCCHPQGQLIYTSCSEHLP